MMSLIDLLFPKVCVGCRGEGSWLCGECMDDLRERTESLSGTPNSFLEAGLSCVFTAFPYYDVVAREAIHRLKYEGVRELAKPLGDLLAEHLAAYRSFDGFMCIPVPLHPGRQLERGFNQAVLLAQQLPCKLCHHLVVRHRSRPPQAQLTLEQRRQNAEGIYYIRRPEILVGRDVLIVDDVITTGSTVIEIAQLAKTAGARSVWAAAVARG